MFDDLRPTVVHAEMYLISIIATALIHLMKALNLARDCLMDMSDRGSRTVIGNRQIKPAKTNKRSFIFSCSATKLQLTVLGLTSQRGLEVICYHRFQ